MKPFSVSEPSKRLTDTYPPQEIVRDAAQAMRAEERVGFLRLWISEGIPFAFRGNPMLYEAMRDWLGKRLGVHPKVITMIGSGRIGYSLAEFPHYGQPFTQQSDLDLSLVSEVVFSRLVADFYRWNADFVEGHVKPRNSKEEQYWPANSREAPGNICMGFLDPKRIPNFPRYLTTQNIAQTMYLLTVRMAETPGGPKVKRASIRVFRDWAVFVRQMENNLSRTLRSLKSGSDQASSK